jgi:general stress protein 26
MVKAATEHVWDLIENIPMALLVSKKREHLDARPMATTVRRAEGRLYILANKGEDSDEQIQDDAEVILSFQKGAVHVVVHGVAVPCNDAGKIADIWTPFDKAWWDGPDDPRIRLISITPGRAEYWEGPGRLISYADMLISAATGKKPDTGDHASVRL